MDTQVAESKPSPHIPTPGLTTGCQQGRHSPVSNQGREVRGELFVTRRHRGGPGSESGEALARVNAAKALQEEEALGLRGEHGAPPRPPSPLPPAQPCWRSWPGSAASQTVCPSQKTWGVGRGRHLFSGWRPGARRRPVRDTRVVTGDSSGTCALGRVSQPADSNVHKTCTVTRRPQPQGGTSQCPGALRGAATPGRHPTAAEGPGRAPGRDSRGRPPPLPCLCTADLLPKWPRGPADSGLPAVVMPGRERGGPAGRLIGQVWGPPSGGSPRSPEFRVSPRRTDNLLSAREAFWQDPRRKAFSKKETTLHTKCTEPHDKGHARVPLAPCCWRMFTKLPPASQGPKLCL